MNDEHEILSVNNLSVDYGENRIIHNLSFDVSNREILMLLGPNGAGKTTLLRALLGLIPYQGSVVWQSQRLSYLPPQEFLERDNLPPFNIKEFFNLKTKDSGAIIRVLNEVGLDATLLTRQFGALSTGQFQRMLIAWALVDNPEVLVLDEPTSGIDVGGEETIYTLLRNFWQKQNLTILLVTHDLNIVWEYASQVLCINKQKMCMGKPDEVLTPVQLKQLYGTGVKYYTHEHA